MIMAKVENKIRDLQFWYPNIPRKLVMAKGISIEAKYVYMYMSCQSETFDFVLKPMAKQMDIGIRTLSKYIDELVKSGWLTKGRQKFVNGRLGAVDYIIETSPKKNNRQNTDVQKSACSISDVSKSDDKYNSIILNNPVYEDNSTILNSPVNKEKEEKRLSNDNPKNKRFVKPTIEQIQAYIDEKNMHFEAERFFDYYESKGWMVGKNHMKDWKAACRTWESMRKSEKREEKEESAQVQEMSEVEAIVWKNNQEWMEKMVPRLKDRITYDDFCKMRAMAHFKADVYADILVHIEKSGYDGDIVDEFDRMCETEYYERIWGNG